MEFEYKIGTTLYNGEFRAVVEVYVNDSYRHSMIFDKKFSNEPECLDYAREAVQFMAEQSQKWLRGAIDRMRRFEG
jgi:hypothetical protein